MSAHDGGERGVGRGKVAAFSLGDVAIMVGMACLLTSCLVYSCSVTPLLRYEAISAFMEGNARNYIWAFAVTSSAFLVTHLLLRGRPRLRRWFEAAVPIVGGLLFVIGDAVMVLNSSLGAMSQVARLMICVCVGAGSCFLLVGWGRLLRRYDLRMATIMVCGAMVLAVALGVLVGNAAPGVSKAAFLACALVAASVPLIWVWRHADVPDQDEDAGSLPAGAASAAPGKARTFLGIVAMPAVGLVFFSSILALQGWRFASVYHLYCASQVLVAVVIAAMVLALNPVLLTRVANRGLLPVLAVAAVVASNVTVVAHTGVLMQDFLMLALFGASAMLAFASLIGMAHAREFSSDLIVTVACVIFSVATLLPPWLLSVFSLQADLGAISAAASILTGLYAMVLVVFSLVQSAAVERSFIERGSSVGATGQGPDLSDVGGARALSADVARASSERRAPPTDASASQGRMVPVREGLARACDDVAAEYGLTSREREILEYLALGYTSVSIGEALFISPNTVRTHVFNIHRKLGVSSREEAIEVVRSRQAGVSGV